MNNKKRSYEKLNKKDPNEEILFRGVIEDSTDRN
jgi:hypothetical protein